MRKDSAKRLCFIVMVTALLIAGNGAVYAEPLLVMQPAYVGMTFYVHQPNGIPVNWYTTFDGYPVWKGADGVWFYGSYSDKNIIPTHYVVGSVVPSLVDIYPYPYVTQTVVATPSAPVATQTATVAIPYPVDNRVVAAYPAPAVMTAAVATAVVPVGCSPRWDMDPCFMALATWRGNVDRVGILVKPSIPVAWKGKWPQVLYAWTGSQWYQMTANDGERPGDVLKKNLYVLTRLVHQNGKRDWQAQDVALLVSRLPQWGYIWMGEIGPNPQRVY